MTEFGKRWLAVGLGAALLTGLGAVSVAAQEEEDERRKRVSIAFAGGGSWLGVEISDVDDERAAEAGMARPYGVYIRDVVDDGPASEGGIEDGDVILRWNGERVEGVAQLRRILAETPPGRVADVAVRRDGAEREVSVELGDRGGRLGLAAGRGPLTFVAPQVEVSPMRLRAARERAADAQQRAMERVREAQERVRGTLREVWISGRARLGASTQSLGDQLAEYFGVEGGALVTAVAEDSPAAAGGLRAGDVIVGVGDDDVADPGDLRGALSDLDAGEVSVRIVRDGAERTLTVELEERERTFRWRGV